jgi:rhodanese-related sulfurtransferase
MAVPRITREELKARLEAGDPPVILDVRLKYPYEHSTVMLPGAIRMLPDTTSETPPIPAGRDVVIYDSDPDELVGAPIAAGLIRKGHKVVVLKGGIADWMAANLPTQPKDAPTQPPPAPGALKG